MPYQLILCEKPSAAAKIAYALAEDKVSRRAVGGIPAYYVERNGKKIVVVSALGHLYTVDQQASGWSFPVFDIGWVPSYSAPKKKSRSRVWIEALVELSKGAESFVSACDFDTEGSLIAYMVLKYACGGADKLAQRMKFSTLSKGDIVSAYETMSRTLDLSVIYAGKTRHELDWIFGINTSRALMDSVSRSQRRFEILSAGRVQSPTLNLLFRREREINLHIPDPFWTVWAEVEVSGETLNASYSQEEIYNFAQANAVVERCNGAEARVVGVKKAEEKIPPPCPFDLGSLQREAYRQLRLGPSRTQKVAERLYLDALISYPRTASQKLPRSLGLEGIIRRLSISSRYRNAAEELLRSGKPLVPREGKKFDPAHPAIHPTGKLPERIGREEAQVYELIVRRFLACFGEWAVKEHIVISIGCGPSDVFLLRGESILVAGWMEHYGTQQRERELPKVEVGEPARVNKAISEERFTPGPPRFNPSSIISAMERNGLGTKSTRGEVLDTLYRRHYIEGSAIRVTDLGLAIIPVLRRFFPELTNVGLTKRIGREMESIEAGSLDPQKVLEETVEELKPLFERVIARYDEVGKELSDALGLLRSKQSRIGPCPNCGSGTLTIIYSRKTRKRFIGCTNYANGCRFSLPLPQRGRIRQTGTTCSVCGLPVVEVGGFRSKVWRLCVNNRCPSKERVRDLQRPKR
jgi:DNA topoisomerase-1